MVLTFLIFEIFHTLFDKVSLKSYFFSGLIVEISCVLASSLFYFLSISFEIKFDAVGVDF